MYRRLQVQMKHLQLFVGLKETWTCLACCLLSRVCAIISSQSISVGQLLVICLSSAPWQPSSHTCSLCHNKNVSLQYCILFGPCWLLITKVCVKFFIKHESCTRSDSLVPFNSLQWQMQTQHKRLEIQVLQKNSNEFKLQENAVTVNNYCNK